METASNAVDTTDVYKDDKTPVDKDNPDKLTNWANEPTVGELKQDYMDATADHDYHENRIKEWLDNRNIEGKAKIDTKDGYSDIVPKLIRKQAEWRYASLAEPFLSTEDIYNTAPVTHEDKDAAEQNGLVLNNQFNTQIQKVRFIGDYVRTAVDEGTVIVRTGWEFEEKEREVDEPIYVTIPVTDPALAQTMINNGQQPETRIQTGTKKVTKMVTVKNQPTVEVCDYKRITIDPSCEGDITKAKFITYDFMTSLSELKEAGIYSNLDQIVANNSSPLADDDFEASSSDSSFNFKDKPRELLVAREYWGFRDIDGSGTLTAIKAVSVGDVKILMEENPFPDKELPFTFVQYLPVRKSMYGEPDGALLEDNQRINGAITRGMIDLMGRSANSQQGTAKDFLDVANKRKFDRGEDYEFNPNKDPRTNIHMGTYPEIPRSAIEMLGIQNAEAESLTGVKAFNNGINSRALGDSVGGIGSALDAAAKRESDILGRLADGMKQIGRKIMSMNGEFLDEEEVVRLTDEEFVTIKRDDLAGNIDIKLSISTAEADSAKANDLSFMLQTLGNNMPPEFTQLVLAEIADLRNMPALAKRVEEFTPEPDPMQQAIAQKQLELLDAQIANEKAKAGENAVDIGLKKAKTVTEQAKARDLNSDADSKDLTFLNDESGLSRQHEENMENVKSTNRINEKGADKLLNEDEKNFTKIPALQ